MNLRLFNKLVKEEIGRLHLPEWKMFLEICDLYLKRKRIKNPTVVEAGLGLDGKSQCNFFEQLFEAKYISEVDPDKETIDILSISGGYYEDVKRNFERFSPLCNGIIAIHDIECCRHNKRKVAESWKFWDELKLRKCEAAEEHKDSLFLSIYKRRGRGRQRGIGVIIKNGFSSL